MNNRYSSIAVAAVLLLAGSVGATSAHGQGHAGHGQPMNASPPAAGPRITMEALHAAGGVPPGWRFAMPAGDAAAGRQAFVDLKCYTCHAIQGEQFPLKPGEVATAGPDLSGMGRHHPTEYLVESILNPSAVLVEGPGYIGGDGRSIMPATPEMTVAQLANLVAYLKATSPDMAPHAHDASLEQTAGGYRIRLVYRVADTIGEPAHHRHGASATAAPGKGRLLAFVTDAASGQPISYVPVTARIAAAGNLSQNVKLAPAMGAEGFHYGADLTLPDKTNKVTLTIGPSALQLRAGAPAQLARTQTVAFDWK